MLRNSRVRTRSRTLCPRIAVITRALLCLMVTLAGALPVFAQHYYAKVDHYTKIDSYAKMDGSGSLANFQKLPVPPIASKCSRNSGSLCSTSNSVVSAAKTSKPAHELDQMAKQSASSLQNAANHEKTRSVGIHKPTPAARSGNGSGMNASNAGSRRASTRSSAPYGKRRR